MDPTYPSIPVVALISALLMLLTILTSVRQTWNTGVLMLCTWLFFSDFIQGVEAIIWSRDAKNRAPVWCDISSHLGLAVGTAVPACSLVITRRLCDISRLRAIDAPSKRERRVQLFLDLFIGIGIPIIVMGPLYYVVQANRFQVVEQIGCGNAIVLSGMSTVLIDAWPVISPPLSAILYCPRIVWTFYRHRREVDAFLRSNGSVDRVRYFRVLAVGCLDILFTLPTGALILLLDVAQGVKDGSYSFYSGWKTIHQDWAPVSISAAEWHVDLWFRFQLIFQEWLYLVLSILIFAIFGLTEEARATYRRWFWSAAGLFHFEPIAHESLPDMKFDRPPRRVSSLGHSLSMLEANMIDSKDLTTSIWPPGEGGLADDVIEIAHEDHSRSENDSEDVDTLTEQARNADEAEGDVVKEKVETVLDIQGASAY
ncbi:pheromone A receptor-domain-containing protein [Amylostereum chailletii]|nr:pheromone A receptor-domain-containing protein [Amylostereum chailletii]